MSSPELAARLKACNEAFRREDWKSCVALCRELLQSINEPAVTAAIKLKLAHSIVLDPNTATSELHEAIACYNQLLLQAPEKSTKWSEMHRNLGNTYSRIAAGEWPRTETLRTVAWHYEQSLSGLTIDDALRASIATQAAYAIMHLENEQGQNNVERASMYLREALVVFTANEYPEEYLEVSLALKQLEGKRDMQ